MPKSNLMDYDLADETTSANDDFVLAFQREKDQMWLNEHSKGKVMHWTMVQAAVRRMPPITCIKDVEGKTRFGKHTLQIIQEVLDKRALVCCVAAAAVSEKNPIKEKTALQNNANNIVVVQNSDKQPASLHSETAAAVLVPKIEKDAPSSLPQVQQQKQHTDSSSVPKRYSLRSRTAHVRRRNQ